MDYELSRAFRYATEFYRKRIGLVVLFSVPFIFAFLIPVLVPAPTYLALGGVFLRTGSLPELSLLDMIITALGYAIAVFLIADTIVNINIVVRSRRTLTDIKSEVVSALGTYGMRIFYIYTLMLLLLFILQLITYDNAFQSWIYPLGSLIISYLLFFVPPAVVIDGSGTAEAIRRSASMALRKPWMFATWISLAFLVVSVTKIIGDILFSSPFSGYFVLLVNSLVLLPYLTVLQTQMYMEKYPLAR